MAVAAHPSKLEPEVFRWKRTDYRQFLGSGIVDDPARFELVDGLVFQRTMENPSHSLACGLVQDAFEALPAGFHVRVQHPLAIDDISEPEPDLAVIRGARRDFRTEHPNSAELIVEVSDSTLHIDRGRKLRAYARNSQPEYWILNLVDHQLEVYRTPNADEERFEQEQMLGPSDQVCPLTFPDLKIAVGELLP